MLGLPREVEGPAVLSTGHQGTGDPDGRYPNASGPYPHRRPCSSSPRKCTTRRPSGDGPGALAAAWQVAPAPYKDRSLSQRTLPGWVPVRGHCAYRRPGASAETSVRDAALGLRTDSCRSQTRAVITGGKKHLRSRTRKRSHKRYGAVSSEVHISQDRHSTPGRVDRTFVLHTRRRSLSPISATQREEHSANTVTGNTVSRAFDPEAA